MTCEATRNGELFCTNPARFIIATWRTADPKQRAKAAQRPYVPPAKAPEGHPSLLDLIEDGEPA